MAGKKGKKVSSRKKIALHKKGNKRFASGSFRVSDSVLEKEKLVDESDLAKRVHAGFELFANDPVFVRLTRQIHSHIIARNRSERGKMTLLRKAQEKLILGELSARQYQDWWKELRVPDIENSPYIQHLLKQNRPNE